MSWFAATVLMLAAFCPRVFSQASLFDSSFAVGAGANGTVHSIAVQNDGKILVGGEFTEIAGQVQPYLARLNSNGQIDASFPTGTDGTVYRLLQQPDGKILIGGGFSNLQGVARQSIGRLLTNGAVDLSFDAGTNFTPTDAVLALACQSDEKILAATGYFSGSNYSLFKRLASNGQLDSSFVQTNIFHTWFVLTICPRTNGTVLVGGGFQSVNDYATAGLALLEADGRLDTNFNSQFQTSLSSVLSIVEQTDGALLISGGYWRQGLSNRTVIAKMTPSLAWNTNFESDAFDPTSAVARHPYATAIQLQPDGKMLVGGNFYEVGGYWRRHIVRLDSQGRVDPCFDPAVGLGGFDGVNALALQADGRILVGGKFGDEFSYTNLTRLLPQSDCNSIRVHLGKYGNNSDYVAGTCSPGGTNHMQTSTNLVEWITVISTISPYVYFDQLNISALEGGLFFRIKKEY